MICIKLHSSYRNTLAVCDSELIGKKFEEGKRVLHAKESFFKGDEVSEEETINAMKTQMLEDSTFNIIGPKSVEAAKKAGLINPQQIATIQGVPFILVLL